MLKIIISGHESADAQGIVHYVPYTVAPCAKNAHLVLEQRSEKQIFIFGCFLLDFWDHGNKAVSRRTTNFLNYVCENVAVTKRIQQPLDAYFAREKK